MPSAYFNIPSFQKTRHNHTNFCERGEHHTMSSTTIRKQAPAPVLDLSNRRFKVYDQSPEEARALLAQAPPACSKIICYARPGVSADWARQGFRHEGVIRGYFRDRTDAHLWTCYPNLTRSLELERPVHEEALRVALGRPRLDSSRLPAGYSTRRATESDAPQLSALLQATFPVYPSPLDSGHLARLIRERANLFRLVLHESGELAAAASAELDHEQLSAEMTDCATDPAHRGKGLMARLLWRLELDVAEDYRVRDLYTLARAAEVPMNCVFSKLGYRYTGRLINNCRMPNGWESVNVWCKQLP